ncbi:MAG TPA: aldo/keto reductase [Bryobacteraceae bacterium]|nr:aldo/keto reductase [Bryobacteraceae bacterium]
MNEESSRRRFLIAGIGAPAVLTAMPQKLPPKPDGLPELIANQKLEYRVLGKTGLKVTRVAFGTMITSDPTVIQRAADLGVNYFDTARVYQNGNCERMVGAALKGRRDRVFISTKTGAGTKEQALADLDTSLKELATDHVDIWYLHGKSKPDQLKDELMEAQQIARRAGKIRFAGVSTHGGQAELMPAIVAHKDHFDVVLTAYNYFMETTIEEPIRQAADAGLGIVAMKVMAGGKRASAPKTKEILGHEGASLAALKWVLRNLRVDTAIPSMTDMDQLDENLKAMWQPLSPIDEKVLQARAAGIRESYCNMCGACEGQCTHGLAVADMLRFYMYSDGYGQFSLGRDHFRALPAQMRDVRCGDCPECTVQCPRGVHVQARLSRAQECFA